MAHRRKPKCVVQFDSIDKSALLTTPGGYVLNAINYPKNMWPLSKAEKARAKKKLMRGCAEMLRDRTRYR